MGRKRTGHARFIKGKWRAQFYDGGERVMVTFHDMTDEERDRERAERAAERLSQQAAQRALAPARGGGDGRPPPLDEYPTHLANGRETFAGWAARWCDDREARLKLSSARDERSRLRYHVAPLFGRLAVAAVERADLESLVRELDAKVEDGRLSWKTAKNIWGIVGKAFDDCKNSKRTELRARGDDPTDGVQGPDAGPEKAKVYLFPDEALRLASCAEVPLERRRLYALATYTGLRRSEIAALRVRDVVLEHGYLAVHKKLDRDDQESLTKTKVARRASTEHEAKALLAFFVRGRGPADRLVGIEAAEHLAEQLRDDLKLAGVRRAELFASDAVRKPITFHDLRATHATWMAVRGDEAAKIQRRLGHADLKTTMGYVREAEILRDAGVDIRPFPPLPPELCGLPPTPPEWLDPTKPPGSRSLFSKPIWQTYYLEEPNWATEAEREKGFEPSTSTLARTHWVF